MQLRKQKNYRPTFMKIMKAKSVQAFKPDPYVATLLNCSLWLFYALPIVHPNSLLVITINSIGITIEVIFIAIFLRHSTWGGRVCTHSFPIISYTYFPSLVSKLTH